MNVYFREFIIFDEIKIIFQQIYNRQTNLKKKNDDIVKRMSKKQITKRKYLI